MRRVAIGQTSEAIKRITLRMHSETAARAVFWASRAQNHNGRGISLNEYIVEAIEEKISRDCGEIPDVDNLVVNRLNEMIDRNEAMAVELTNLSTVVNKGFDSLVALGRSDNFMLDPGSGELNE